jgi:hypothetical protein
MVAMLAKWRHQGIIWRPSHTPLACLHKPAQGECIQLQHVCARTVSDVSKTPQLHVTTSQAAVLRLTHVSQMQLVAAPAAPCRPCNDSSSAANDGHLTLLNPVPHCPHTLVCRHPHPPAAAGPPGGAAAVQTLGEGPGAAHPGGWWQEQDRPAPTDGIGAKLDNGMQQANRTAHTSAAGSWWQSCGRQGWLQDMQRAEDTPGLAGSTHTHTRHTTPQQHLLTSMA